MIAKVGCQLDTALLGYNQGPILKQTDLKLAYQAARHAENALAGTQSPIRLVPRRSEILRHALRLRGTREIVAEHVLLEYNTNKTTPAEYCFDQSLRAVNPRKMHLPLRFRAILLLLMAAPSRVVVSVYLKLLAQMLSKYALLNSAVYVYNPYHMLHLIPTLTRFTLHVYFHNAEIMERQQRHFRCASSVYGTSHVLARWSASQDARLVKVQPRHRYVSDERCVAVYFTNLTVFTRARGEERLGDFALWLLGNVSEPVRVFLHYQDVRLGQWSQRLERIGMSGLIPHVVIPTSGRSSLDELSSQQVSFSASSSIGGELISLGINHFVIDGTIEDPFEEIARRLQLSVITEGQ